MVDSSIQMSRCEEFTSDTESKICIAAEKKTCACCVQRHHVPTTFPEVLHFAQVVLGSPSKVDVLTVKSDHFPYEVNFWTVLVLMVRRLQLFMFYTIFSQMLHLGLRRIEQMGFPPRSLFQNALKDNKLLSEHEYDDFRRLCASFSVTTARDLLIWYVGV